MNASGDSASASNEPPPRVVFAGDRDIAVGVLEFLLERGVRPLALLLPEAERASHAEALRERCDYLGDDRVWRGPAFSSDDGVQQLRALAPDYLLCIHFPLLVPPPVLEIPVVGALNLHPAFLPYNRGWHTPSWALLDGTPYGATLHFMEEALDAGPIVHQKRLTVRPQDTADTLYQRAKTLEREVFEEAWPLLKDGDPPRRPQQPEAGTSHRRADLFAPGVQRLPLGEARPVADVLDRLRALTTDRLEEAAYFEKGGVRYRVQVRITPDPD